MIINNRIILSKNGTLKDISLRTANYLSGSETLTMVTGLDKLYIGSDLPFNHRYFDMVTPNDVPTNVLVEYFSASQPGLWVPAVNQVDETSNALGCSLGQSGIISFTPDRHRIWEMRDTKDSTSNMNIPELLGVTIYDLYWCRISFDQTIKASTAVRYIGHKFALDSDVAVLYPDLVQQAVYQQFDSAKTDWNVQLIYASEIVVRDLKTRGIIKSGNQILDWYLFKDAAVHKLAEVVYHAFGKDYAINEQKAHAAYKSSLNLSIFNTDQNADARLTPIEKGIRSGYLCR